MLYITCHQGNANHYEITPTRMVIIKKADNNKCL